MKKFTEISILLDIYGSMLTSNQRDIMDLYYNYDLTLAEIAENKDITRQGVHDIIKRSEHTLRRIEDQLKLSEKLIYIDTSLKAIDTKLISLSDSIYNSGLDKSVMETIHEIRLDVRSIMENLNRQEDEQWHLKD